MTTINNIRVSHPAEGLQFNTRRQKNGPANDFRDQSHEAIGYGYGLYASLNIDIR